MVAIVLRTTHRIGTVTVKHEARAEGVSGSTTAKLLSLWSNLFLGFSIYPLRVVAFLGIVISLMGIALGLFDTFTLGTSAMLVAESIAF